MAVVDSEAYLRANPNVREGWAGTAQEHYDQFGRFEIAEGNRSVTGTPDDPARQSPTPDIVGQVTGQIQPLPKIKAAKLSDQDLAGTEQSYAGIGPTTGVSTALAAKPDDVTSPDKPAAG